MSAYCFFFYSDCTKHGGCEIINALSHFFCSLKQLCDRSQRGSGVCSFCVWIPDTISVGQVWAWSAHSLTCLCSYPPTLQGTPPAFYSYPQTSRPFAVCELLLTQLSHTHKLSQLFFVIVSFPCFLLTDLCCCIRKQYLLLECKGYVCFNWHLFYMFYNETLHFSQH